VCGHGWLHKAITCDSLVSVSENKATHIVSLHIYTRTYMDSHTHVFFVIDADGSARLLTSASIRWNVSWTTQTWRRPDLVPWPRRTYKFSKAKCTTQFAICNKHRAYFWEMLLERRFAAQTRILTDLCQLERRNSSRLHLCATLKRVWMPGVGSPNSRTTFSLIHSRSPFNLSCVHVTQGKPWANSSRSGGCYVLKLKILESQLATLSTM